MYDVLIIGAGSAGLAAALTLGRCCRRVLLADGGPPRNADSPAVHNFLTRDGIRPAELLRLGRAELAPYPTVEIAPLAIETLSRDGRHFRATGRTTDTDAPRALLARAVLLATGVADVLPPLPGFRALWGRGVLHCPYCHGYEVRQLPLAVFGHGRAAINQALLVSRWSADVVLLTHGGAVPSDRARRQLRRQRIGVEARPVARLVGNPDGSVRCVEFEDGTYLERSAVFITAAQEQRSGLVAALGTRLTAKGAVWTDRNNETTVPGLFAAGDASPGTQQALLAAAQGSQAGICLHEKLTREEVA